MVALSFVAVFLLILGDMWTGASLIGTSAVGRALGQRPEDPADTPSARYAYTMYGGYSRRGTLYAGVVILVLGVLLLSALLALDDFALEG